MLKDLWVPGFVSKFSNLREAKIHSWSDYVSCAYTVFIFMICSALTGWALNFKKPMHCLIPAQFPESWINYVTDYCFIQSTFLVPDLDDMYKLRSDDSASVQYVAYYQWVPYVLFFMPFLFFLPKIFWAFTVSRVCALSLDTIIVEAEEANKDITAKREEGLKRYCTLLKKHLILAYENRFFNFFPTTIICYIITKWFYVVISVMQILILMIFVEEDDMFWGYKAVINSIQASKWLRIETFPYVSFCKIDRAVDFANSNTDTLQCLLVMNMLNDKVLVFLSIWMTIVLAISVISALITTFYYIKTLISPSLGDIMPDEHIHSRNRVKRFVNNHIHVEGILVLNMLKEKVSPLFANEVANNLWLKMVDTETHGLAYKAE